MLKIKNLSFSYGSSPILTDCSLELKQGEIATIIGPSGSGKTTLLRMVAGLVPAKKGTISYLDAPSKSPSDHVAYMNQDDIMLPWRTIIKNLTLIGELGKKKHSPNLYNEALRHLNEMGLAGRENAYPHELSGGMRQRVALARVLMQKKPFLLLDEPFASLDMSLREQMHLHLKKIRSQHGTTILMVTHDLRDALSLSDKIFLLDRGTIARAWDVPKDNPLSKQSLHDEILKLLMGLSV